MRLTKYALLTTLLMAACAPAQTTAYGDDTIDGPIPYVTGSTYTCTPSNFTLTQTQVLDTGGTYHLRGTMDMLTPGYTYKFTARHSLTAEYHVYTMDLIKPSGMAAQVITPVEISYKFGGVPYLEDVKISVEGGANWQPETISCKRDE